METSKDKGEKYEKFISNVINSLSEKIGEYYSEENIKLRIDKKKGEIDIYCTNENSCLYVECKNEEKKVIKNEIRAFSHKVQEKYYKLKKESNIINKEFYAFFVSKYGFTSGVYDFFLDEDPLYNLTGRHINFYCIEPTILQIYFK